MPKLALIFVAFFLTIFLFQESSYGFIEGFDSPPLPNFDITKSTEESIENTEGVELLNIMTRYRFFLGVGKMFDFSSVRRLIEESVCGSKLDEDTEEAIDMIKDSISSDRYWAIFVSQSGEILYASTNADSDEAYLDKLNHYQKRKKKNGGFIFQND